MTIPAYMFVHHVSVAWPARGETREQCATRAFNWLALLRECDPSFSQWYLQGETKAQALRYRVDLDATVLASRLKEDTVLGHRSFFQSVWTGSEEGQNSSVAFHVGHTNPESGEGVEFTAPSEGPVASRIVTAGGLTAILRSMVLAWDPEVGSAESWEFLQAAFSKPGPAPEGTLALAPHEERIGWVNYYARSRGPIPPLPSPVRTEPVEDKGTLVILGDEKLSGADPAHVALAQQVSAELKKAGVLKPW